MFNNPLNAQTSFSATEKVSIDTVRVKNYTNTLQITLPAQWESPVVNQLGKLPKEVQDIRTKAMSDAMKTIPEKDKAFFFLFMAEDIMGFREDTKIMDAQGISLYVRLDDKGLDDNTRNTIFTIGEAYQNQILRSEALKNKRLQNRQNKLEQSKKR